MNFGNLKLYQCIITTNTDSVESYIKVYDENYFDPICLNCALDEEKNNLKGTLISLVTYINCYKDINKRTILLYFGLCEYVSVNSISRKPNLKKWKENIDIDEESLVLKQLNTTFALK